MIMPYQNGAMAPARKAAKASDVQMILGIAVCGIVMAVTNRGRAGERGRNLPQFPPFFGLRGSGLFQFA